MILLSVIAIKQYGENGGECNHIVKGKRSEMQFISRENGRKMQSSALGELAGITIHTVVKGTWETQSHG